MRHSTAAALVGAAVLLGTQFVGPSDSPAQSGAAKGSIRDQYIVVLRDDVSDPRAVAQQHANVHALGVLKVYEHALKGYAAKIPPARLNAVRATPRLRTSVRMSRSRPLPRSYRRASIGSMET